MGHPTSQCSFVASGMSSNRDIKDKMMNHIKLKHKEFFRNMNVDERRDLDDRMDDSISEEKEYKGGMFEREESKNKVVKSKSIKTHNHTNQ